MYTDFRDLKEAPENLEGYKKIEVVEDTSRIALCTLSAINLGNIKNLDDIEGWMDNAVSGLDNLLTYQQYMVPAAREATLDYRPLGVGIINLAYYLAKNNLRYSDEGAWQLMHETMEAIQFYAIKASVELAKKKGPCRLYERTKYAQGLLPIDHYNKNVDDIVKPVYNLDWEWLRKEVKQYGIRNACLTAAMPAESSAKISNSTNGAEPVRSLVTIKGNKGNVSKQVVPEINRLKNKYDMLWDMTSQEGIIKTMAVMQKFMDQSISMNLSYNPEHYEDNEIPMSLLLKDLLLCAKYGIKTLYYHNTYDGRDEDEEPVDEAPNLENSQVEEDLGDEEDCDSCKI